MEQHLEHARNAESSVRRPLPAAAVTPVARDSHVEERRAAAMRSLFPLWSTGRAHGVASAVARRLYAYLSQADSADELERRLRFPQHYPHDLIEEVRLNDGRPVVVRPILPADAERQRAFVRAMSPATRLFRFHGVVADLPEAVLRYLTEVDYDDHLALVAEAVEGDEARQVAEARWVRREDAHDGADFAIAIADDYQARGLGNALMDRLQRSAAAKGIRRLHGHVLRSNRKMRGWLAGRGWSVEDDPLDPGVVCVELRLDPTAGTAFAWREAA